MGGGVSGGVSWSSRTRTYTDIFSLLVLIENW